jgi:hypothetical protein
VYLQDIRLAQEHALKANGYGIVAASKNGLKTGFGDDYFAALHIGSRFVVLLRGPIRESVCPVILEIVSTEGQLHFVLGPRS